MKDNRDIVRENNSSNICYLVGAGFTYAITNGESLLTDQLMDNISGLIIPELENEFKSTYPNIELFITLLDIKKTYIKNKTLTDKISETRKDIIENIVSNYDINKLRNDYTLCGSFVKKLPPNAKILTLNYDCVLDKYLWLSGEWCPTRGYWASAFPSTCSDCNDNGNCNRNSLLLKLHGSCNFREPGDEKQHEQQNWNGRFKIEITEEIFPGINSHINPRTSSIPNMPHVLIMSYLKIYGNDIMKLWDKAIDILRESERLVIIGCSLRDEDTFLKFALFHFGMTHNNNFYIDIVEKDKESFESVKSKINKIVANSQEPTFYSGLENYLNQV